MDPNQFRIAPPRHRTAMWISARLLVACACLGAASLTSAPAAETDAIPSAVASIMDEQAVAVVGIDTKRVDLDAVVAQVSAIPVMSERDRGNLAGQKKRLAQWFELFQRSGGRDVWLVLTLADELLDAPLIVVPLHGGASREGLESLFVKAKLAGGNAQNVPFLVEAAIERNGALILGSDSALKRIQRFNGPLRAIPKEAVEAVAGAELRAFLLPTNDQRRVLSEFLRDRQAEHALAEKMRAGAVPAELLRDPAAVSRLALTDGLQWLAVGITTHDTLALKLVIGSKDATSAQALALWMSGAWQLAKENFAAPKAPDSQTVAALIDQLARLFAPKVEENRLTVQVDVKQLVGSVAGTFLGKAALGAAQKAESSVVKNHLKQLALAMHNYHDVNKHFPPAAIRDAQGRPLLSWRVMLLPYLDQNDLYQQFHLDEPWDSEHNKSLIAKMPDVYAPSSAQLREQGKTTYLAPVGKQTIFGSKEGVPIRDITDGTSNTILIVDADAGQAVVWTKPDDLNVDGVDAKQALFGTRKEGFNCAYADGSAQFLGPELDSAKLHALLTYNGGEPVTGP